MQLSIVISVFNEKQVLNIFYDTLIMTLENKFSQYEIIFVNDGSTDGTKEIMNSFRSNPNVKLIHFSRNFGHEAAMIAGIDHAKGDAIICMDSDLQHPPSQIAEMMRLFQNEKVDIINMVNNQINRKKTSSFFYYFLNKISAYDIAGNASDFFLISARVADVLRNDYRERVRFLRGFIQIIGFRKMTLEFEVAKRASGNSKYSLNKLLKLSFSAIANLSKLPLKIGIYAGMSSALFSFILVIYSLVMWIIDKPLPGYSTIIIFLGVMFSILFFLLGIIGEYLGFMFDEIKGRPLYILEETHNL